MPPGKPADRATRKPRSNVGHNPFQFADRDGLVKMSAAADLSHGAGQIRPSTAGRAMSVLTVISASRSWPAAIWRSICGMFICAGSRRNMAHRQSPKWSLKKQFQRRAADFVNLLCLAFDA